MTRSGCRVAREWHEPIAGTYLGSGQRMLATNAGEYPLFEIREVCFDASPTAAPEPTSHRG